MSTDDRSRRNHARYAYDKGVRVVAGGREHAGRVQDISRGGAALLLNSSLDNTAFVDLHVEGFGRIPSQVVRKFDNGVGVEFDLSDEAREVMAAAEGKNPSTQTKPLIKTGGPNDDPLTDTVHKFFDLIDSLKEQK